MAETIVHVTPELIPELVASSGALFTEDGGQHDPWMDTDWPRREGAAYYQDLLTDDNLFLLARSDGTTAGHLIGRLTTNALRPDARTAVLQSLRVAEEHRRTGLGSALVAEFTKWAAEKEANEFKVTAFAANERAIAFYRKHGFVPFELTLRRPA